MILYAIPHKAQHIFPSEVQQFLHEQLQYIRDQAQLYRRKFNFALLAEEAHKRFGYPFQRNSIRRFALRHGDYHQRAEEKGTVYVRFEMPGPGISFNMTPHAIVGCWRWGDSTIGFSPRAITPDAWWRPF